MFKWKITSSPKPIISYNYQKKKEFLKEKISYTCAKNLKFFITDWLSIQLCYFLCDQTNKSYDQKYQVLFICEAFLSFNILYFLYTQPAFVFHFFRDFYTVWDQIVSFCFSLLQKDLGTLLRAFLNKAFLFI